MDILLVEDNPADVYLLREEFAALGDDHRLAVADSLAAAIAAIRAARPDAVLLDLSLPDSFGIESLESLTAAAPDLPVIILSGNADRTMALEAVRKGAQDYVLKGRTDPDGLLRTLQYAIERARIKAELRRSEARFRRLFDSVPVGVFQMDEAGTLLAVNSALARTLGFDQERDVLRAARAGSLFADAGELAEARRLLADEGLLDGFELGLHRRGGEIATLLVSAAAVRDATSGEATVEGTMVDISERKEAEQQLRAQAEIDELTGLVNRRAFRAITTAALAAAGAGYPRIAPVLLMFDLDGFKAVNDELGHAAGDELLRAIATRVGDALRQEDTFARLGGDEFAVLASAAARNDVERVAAKLRDLVGQPFTVAGSEVEVGASIGIALYPADGTHYEALLARADDAMYAAKRAGKSCYVFAGDAGQRSGTA